MDQVVHDLYGNGQVGFIAEARDFFSRADERAANEKEFHDTRDAEIKRAIESRERRENRRWTLIMAILTVIGIVVAIVGVLEANRQMHGKFSFTTPDSALASTQDAGGKWPSQ